MTTAFLEAQAIVNAFSSPAIKDAGIVLEAIEIGNEADFYMKNRVRPKTFTSKQYVAECVLISSAREIFTDMIDALQVGLNSLVTCLH